MLAKTANLMSGHLSDKQKAANKREFLKSQQVLDETRIKEAQLKRAAKYKRSPWQARRHEEFVIKVLASRGNFEAIAIRQALLAAS